MTKSVFLVLVSGLVSASAASVVSGAVITLQQGTAGYTGHGDAVVRNDGANAGNNYGGATVTAAAVGVLPGGGMLRDLHKWDLSSIPSGATITSVTLTMGHRSDSGTQTYTDNNTEDDDGDPLYELRTISETFTEGTKNGAAGSPGEATWNTTFGATMTLGSQLSSRRFDPTIGAVLHNGEVFGTSAAFVAAAQAALESGSKQFLFALKLADESGSIVVAGNPTANNRIIVQFGTNSSTGTTVPDRPVLTIEYNEIPEPASMGVLGLGGLILLGRRRR